MLVANVGNFFLLLNQNCQNIEENSVCTDVNDGKSPARSHRFLINLSQLIHEGTDAAFFIPVLSDVIYLGDI